MTDDILDAFIPEPKPEFFVLPAHGGQIALGDEGIYPTFQNEGETQNSQIEFTLRDIQSEVECIVIISPVLMSFGYRTSNAGARQFETMQIGFQGAELLFDGCGWDDTHIKNTFASLGAIEIGFSRARFVEDRPRLDVFYDQAWEFSTPTSLIVYVGEGQGYGIGETGIVAPNVIVEPEPGTLPNGFYKW